MDRTSKFMTDHSEGDKGKEAVMDFQVSWVLRMAADDDYTKDKPIFRLYSRYMLFKLLNEPFPNKKEIVSVRVWKEWANIDICAEVELKVGDKKEFHVLLIENKVYTSMKTWQRDDYPKALKLFYQEHGRGEHIPHTILITCTDSDNEFKKLEEFCNGSDWKVISIYDLILDLHKETESELFNEFWIYNWDRLK